MFQWDLFEGFSSGKFWVALCLATDFTFHVEDPGGDWSKSDKHQILYPRSRLQFSIQLKNTVHSVSFVTDPYSKHDITDWLHWHDDFLLSCMVDTSIKFLILAPRRCTVTGFCGFPDSRLEGRMFKLSLWGLPTPLQPSWQNSGQQRCLQTWPGIWLAPVQV